MKIIDAIQEEEKATQTIEDLIKKALIPQGVEIPKPETVFGLNGIPMFTKKSISMLIGKAKSGKTTVTSWIIAQLIQAGKRVVFIDTEQGEYYGSRTQFWILSMARTPINPNLLFFDLKIYPPAKRTEMIASIIKQQRPDAVVIDGVRDLLLDINSAEETGLLLTDLMRWVEEFDTHILTILHKNKGNEHARGTLGTELQNKAETVMQVEMVDELVVCSAERTRNKPFDPFAFDRDSHGMPQLVEGFAGKVSTIVGDKPAKKIDPTDHTFNIAHGEIVHKVFSRAERLTYSEVVSNLKHFFQLAGVDVGTNKAKEFLTHYLQEGRIWKNPYIPGHAKYEKHPQFIELKADNMDPPF